MPQARHQARARPRGLLRGRPQDRGREVRAQPPDAARGNRRGLSQPRQAELRGVPRGLQAGQGERRPRAAVALRGRRDRPDRLPPVALLPASGRRHRVGGPGACGPAASGVRRGQRLLRGPEERRRRAGQGERGNRAGGAGGGQAARRHGRRALPAPGGPRQPQGAAVRADQEHARRAEAVVRHERVLLEGLGRDGSGLRRVARVDRDVARDRRALRGRDRAGEDADPELPDTRRRAGREPTCGGWRTRGCGRATETPRRPRRSSGSRWSWK